MLRCHFPQLRMVVPGYVGTRSVKWLKRITVSEKESQSAWQHKDYKLMPQRYTTLSAAEFATMPPIMVRRAQVHVVQCAVSRVQEVHVHASGCVCC